MFGLFGALGLKMACNSKKVTHGAKLSEICDSGTVLDAVQQHIWGTIVRRLSIYTLHKKVKDIKYP